jgi:hypothetical protein
LTDFLHLSQNRLFLFVGTVGFLVNWTVFPSFGVRHNFFVVATKIKIMLYYRIICGIMYIEKESGPLLSALSRPSTPRNEGNPSLFNTYSITGGDSYESVHRESPERDPREERQRA